MVGHACCGVSGLWESTRPGEKLRMTPQALLLQPDLSATGSSTMWSAGARDDMTIPSQVVELLKELSEARPGRGGRSGS